MKEIKRVKLFANDNDKSKQVENDTREALIREGFEVVDDNNFDLGIAIGGDGSFLRMVNESDFKQDAMYVGINAGTLGFAQDIKVEEVDEFIKSIKNNDYFYEEIGLGEVVVEDEEGTNSFQCLNEIVLREKDLKVVYSDVLIDGVLLENFTGDGLLISTSFGSTAYNLNYGGTIVDNIFDTLQITPIAPISNKTYHSLQNSVVIPASKRITIIPDSNTNDLLITTDGRNYNYSGVTKIEMGIKNHICLIRKQDYNYIRKINDKFIK